MNRKSILIPVLFLLVFSSCIPNRKIAYLQYSNELKRKKSIQHEKVVRTYPETETQYKLSGGDLLDIKISTETPVAYNPFTDADRNLVPGQVVTQQNYQSGSVMTQGYYVGDDGALNLPVIGSVRVAGLTIRESEDTISAHVAKYLEAPVVRVKLLNFRFSVLGEVKNSAMLLSPDNRLTILQAISMAGGATEFGDLSRVKIIRQSEAGENVFYINLLDESFLTGPFYHVLPGDVIVIAPLKQRAYLKYVNPNLNIFATTVSLLVTIMTIFSLK